MPTCYLQGDFKVYISNFICIIWKICLDDWGGCGSRVGYLKHWNRLHVEKVLQFPNITSPPTNQPTTRSCQVFHCVFCLVSHYLSPSCTCRATTDSKLVQRRLGHTHRLAKWWKLDTVPMAKLPIRRCDERKQAQISVLWTPKYVVTYVVLAFQYNDLSHHLQTVQFLFTLSSHFSNPIRERVPVVCKVWQQFIYIDTYYF